MQSKLRIFVMAAAFLLAASAAFAHSHPKVMDPAPNSTVADPHRISIEFSEALEPKFSSLRLTNSAGANAAQAASQVDAADARHMTLDLPHLAPGVYVVHWVTVATDGHRLQGEYQFTVK
jgi:methionine-rich copper-binding protein CopC